MISLVHVATGHSDVGSFQETANTTNTPRLVAETNETSLGDVAKEVMIQGGKEVAKELIPSLLGRAEPKEVSPGSMHEKTNHNTVRVDVKTGKSTISSGAVVAKPHIVHENSEEPIIKPQLPNPIPTGDEIDVVSDEE